MFEVRNSTRGEHKYLIEVDRTQHGGEEHRYAACVAQIVDRLTGDRISSHPQLHFHHGRTPEEAVGKAFVEAEGAWQPVGRIARLVQKARLIFDSHVAPAAQGVRTAGPRLRKLVYATDDYLVDVQVKVGSLRDDTVLVGQITAAPHPTPHVDGARVLLERDTREVARTVTNRLGEFELEFAGPISDLSLTFALPHSHVLVNLDNLSRIAS
jgi:hypothetical protein